MKIKIKTIIVMVVLSLAQARDAPSLDYPPSMKVDVIDDYQGCDRPVLIRVEKQASHGYRPTDKAIAELADGWAFVTAQMKIPQP